MCFPVAALAEGSPGRAETLLGQKLFTFRRHLLENLHQLQPDQPETVRIVLRLAEQAAEFKEELNRLLDLVGLWLRDLLLLTVGRQEKIVNHDLAPLYGNWKSWWNTEQLMKRLSLLEEAKKQLTRNCNRTMVCEVLFFKLL